MMVQVVFIVTAKDEFEEREIFGVFDLERDSNTLVAELEKDNDIHSIKVSRQEVK